MEKVERMAAILAKEGTNAKVILTEDFESSV